MICEKVLFYSVKINENTINILDYIGALIINSGPLLN